jgi:hypothetical protein
MIMMTNTEYFSALNQVRDNPDARFFASGFFFTYKKIPWSPVSRVTAVINVSLNFPIWDKVLVTSEKLMGVESGING